MTAPSESIIEAENVLRRLVEELLKEKLGHQWLENCGISEARREKWREWQQQEENHRHGAVTTDRLLDYSGLEDLGRIIRKHWDTFEPCLKEKETFQTDFGRLLRFRNAVMHNRELLPFERHLVTGITGELRNKVTIFMSSKGPTDEYFARIEYVQDSFGHVVKPPLTVVATGMVLRLGDEVTFECHGWDPHGRDLTWLLKSGPSGPQPLDGNVGTWRASEADIGENCFVRLILASDSEYHRFTYNDGEVSFEYTVLPR